MDIVAVISQLDTLLLSAPSEPELYRRLNVLEQNGRGGWQVLKTPQWVGDRLVIVVVRNRVD